MMKRTGEIPIESGYHRKWGSAIVSKSVAWQVYDANGSPIPEARGSAGDLPAWDCVAVFARADGSFMVVY